MKTKLLFSFLIFPLFSILTFGQTPGVSIFDTSGNEYIEYIPGNLPIIISAPHGGVKQSGSTVGGVFYPDSDTTLPDRSCGTNERDDNTDILIRRIQDEIFVQTGCYAHVIISNLHRSKLDPNREIDEATCGDTDAIFYWNAFHNFIDQASESVSANWGKGLYIDLHGQSHSIPRIEIGYRISTSDLDNTTSGHLNTVTGTTITNLVSNNLNGYSQEELVRGTNSLGELFQNAPGTFYASNNYPGCGLNGTNGYRAVPSASDNGNSSCDDTRPHGNAYFSGFYYNNERHGSGVASSDGVGGGGTIDGIMTEVNRRVRDLGSPYDSRPNTLEPFAIDYANVLLDYIDIHYNDFTDFNYDSANYDTTEADPTPTISGVSGGTFSSTTGLIIDGNTGIIDTSASIAGNYVVTYEAGTCNYYSSTQNIEITDSTLSITDFNEKSFKLFPNPTTGILNFESNTDIEYIKIHTIIGQEINTIKVNSNKSTIDLSNLNSGSFLVSFYVNDKLAKSKLIIKN